MTMGERIQSLRTGCGLSQEQLAGLVGVSRQAVSKWERSEAIPDTNKLAALAGALGTTADELLGGQDREARREEYQGAEKDRPGWLAIHWHWLGVPVCLWGTAVLIRAILGLSIASRMAEGALSIQTVLLLALPGMILPLFAVAGGAVLFFLGRRTIRCRYGQSGGEMPAWSGVKGLLTQRWYWAGIPAALLGVLGFGYKLDAALRLYRKLSVLNPLLSMNFGLETDPGQIYGNMIPSGCLNAQGEIVYDKVFVLLGQGLIFLVTGVMLGSALFLLGRRTVRRRWQEKNEKLVAK
ncbi:MAG: helix-turn-helix domain-containing protein [Lawsonibacter sp.]|jgi:transcriptional regulator with XRE-family HTH domain